MSAGAERPGDLPQPHGGRGRAERGTAGRGEYSAPCRLVGGRGGRPCDGRRAVASTRRPAALPPFSRLGGGGGDGRAVAGAAQGCRLLRTGQCHALPPSSSPAAGRVPLSGTTSAAVAGLCGRAAAARSEAVSHTPRRPVLGASGARRGGRRPISASMPSIPRAGPRPGNPGLAAALVASATLRSTSPARARPTSRLGAERCRPTASSRDAPNRVTPRVPR